MKEKHLSTTSKSGIVIQLLGGFSVSKGQETLIEAAWKSKRARNLVKLLALAPGHRLHRDQVIDTLWPDSDLDAAANNLHQTIFAARQVLDLIAPGLLLLEGGILSLNGDISADVDAFEDAAAQARDTKDSAIYQSALEFYRGDLLPDDRYVEWTLERRETLKQVYLRLLLELARMRETRQEYPAGIDTLLQLLAVDPSHEEAHRGLMRLYAISGQRPQALRQYQVLREVLRSELDVEPSPETTRLAEDIQSGRFPNTDSEQKPQTAAQSEELPSISQRKKHNLPYPITSFIGREMETVLVRSMIQEHRLVTLTGAGGTGKTRLALRVAEGLLDAFQDGIFLVELAPLSDPELVPQACAQTLELIRQPGTPPLSTLFHYLENKQLLLILDNCEHIIAACSSLVDALLKTCPRLTILATSREILNLQGESAFRVPSLLVPDGNRLPPMDEMAGYEAVMLFVDRVRQVSPGFSLTETNTSLVTTICQRLDGIPLAIELAAGRARIMAVEQIGARLDNAFRLLTGGSRAVLPRQQTLKATIDWSYNLLTPKERLLLERLSVFAGGWTLEAAEAVCAEDSRQESILANTPEGDCDHLESFEVLDLLNSLADKSLVIAAVGEGGTRYRMLETIRQYARDRLLETGCAELARDRHLAYFANLTGLAEPHLRGKGQIEWLDQLDQELDNLRAALEWSQTDHVDLGLQIAADLWWFWWVRGLYSESRDWLKKLLTRDEYLLKNQTQINGYDTNHMLQRGRGLRVYVFINGHNLLFTQEERGALAEESVRLLRRLGLIARRELGTSLYYLVANKIGHAQQSPEKQEMLEIFQQEDLRYDYSEFLFTSSYKPSDDADWPQAMLYLEESLAISREIQDLAGIEGRARNLGIILMYEGDYQRAETLVRESIEISRQLKDRWWEAMCYLTVIEIALARGNYEEAAKYSQAVRTVFLDDTEQGRSSYILTVLVQLSWSLGNYNDAAQLGSQILGFYKDKSDNRFHYEAATHYLLGRMALSQKDFGQAESLISMAITEVKTAENKIWVSQILEGAAVMFSQQGKQHQAIQLFGAADEIYQRIRLGLPLRERDENEAALAVSRVALGEAAFAAAWKAGQAMTLDQARVYALENMQT